MHREATRALITDNSSYDVDLANGMTIYHFYSSAPLVLTGNFIVRAVGTPYTNMELIFRFSPNLTLGGNQVVICGTNMPSEFAAKQFTANCYYNGTAWEVRFDPDWENTDIVKTVHIQDLAVTTGKVAANAITLAKMATGSAGAILYYNAGNIAELSVGGAARILQLNAGNTAPQWSAVSGHITMAAGGACTIANTVVTRGMWTALTRGRLVVGAVGDVATDTNFSTNQGTPIGDGNDVACRVPSGDWTWDSAGVATISAGVVTPGKSNATCNKAIIVLPVSFQAGEQCNNRVRIPFKCTVDNIYAICTLVIAGVDNGTITLQNAAAVNMTGGTITFTAADPLNTAYNSAVTANNAVAANDIIYAVTAKATAGGKALVSLEVTKVD